MPGDKFWQEVAEHMFRAVLPLVSQSTSKAVQAGFGMLQVDLDIDWAIINIQVQQRAEQYTYELVKGLTQTSQAVFQEKFAAWVASGEHIDVLARDLAPMFGPVRAEAIAVTEVTRMYAEGNLLSWRLSGVVDGAIWMTAEDDLVCPICKPLDGQVADSLVEVRFLDHVGGPPAHVRCRCWLTPLVSKSKMLLKLIQGRGKLKVA